MTSTSAHESASITLQFSLDRDLDSAAQDVQAMISLAGRRLPPGMPNPPCLRKVNPADQSIMLMSLNSAALPLAAVNEHAENMVSRRTSMLTGGNVYGAQKYAVRAQLDRTCWARSASRPGRSRPRSRSTTSISPPGGRCTISKAIFASSAISRRPRGQGSSG